MPHFYQTLFLWSFAAFCIKLLYTRRKVELIKRAHFGLNYSNKLVLWITFRPNCTILKSWWSAKQKITKFDWKIEFKSSNEIVESTGKSAFCVDGLPYFIPFPRSASIQLSHSSVQSPIRLALPSFNACWSIMRAWVSRFFGWVLSQWGSRALIDWLLGGFTVCSDLRFRQILVRLSQNIEMSKPASGGKENVSRDRRRDLKVELNMKTTKSNQLMGRAWI